MCGISALVDYAGGGPEAGRALVRMHQALRHRGPDGEGFLLGTAAGTQRFAQAPPGAAWAADVRCALAFRQLKIQDLTPSGEQPMGSPDGRHWIVLNGEIYNHHELRPELERLGHRFRSRTDTEVALAAWRAWGPDCFARFNGMWGLLILDLERRALIGSRDRLGIKPLFHSTDGARLLLASEPQAIARARAAGPAIEPVRFAEFLGGLPPQSAERSFFQDVDPVPAGTWFEVPLDAAAPAAITFRAFWRLADHAIADDQLSYERAREELDALLRSAVALQRRAAVPVGCLVSGGIDSSTVATMLAQGEGAADVGAPTAFSVIYDDPAMSEAPYIMAVTGQARLASVRHTLSPREAWNSVDRVVATQGQPLLGQELIAQDRVYALAREHGAIVVLEGQGADELLAGMPLYERAYLRELVLGGRWLRLAGEVRRRRERYGLPMTAALRRFVVAALLDDGRARGGAYPWLDHVPEPAADRLEASRDPSLLNQYLFTLVRHTNLPVVLLYQDRSSMAHGVESRVPFLDHRVVELCFRLPAEFKAGEGERKRILRSVAAAYLPPLILRRTDKKTLVSRSGWLPLRDHADELRAMTADGAMRTCAPLRPNAVTRFVDDYIRGRHDDGYAVWRLYTAWRWLLTLRPS